MLSEWSLRGHLARAFVLCVPASLILGLIALTFAATGNRDMARGFLGIAGGCIVIIPIIACMHWFGVDRWR